jgi:hypothetical protein
MSMPNIPDITPDIDLKREDVINLLLTSIALEEIGISHLLNAEGEKMQKAIKMATCFEDLINANKSTEKMIRTLIKKEMLLQFKLEDVLEIPEHHHPPHHKPHHKPHHPPHHKPHHPPHHKPHKHHDEKGYDKHDEKCEDNHDKKHEKKHD